MNERRIARLQQQIKARVAQVLHQDLADPRLGFITVTRVLLDREIQNCKIYWSVLGSNTDRKLTAAVLENANGLLRREVARVMHTRSVPTVQFLFDQSIEGSIRVSKILEEINPDEDGDDSTEQNPDQDPPADQAKPV